MKKKRKNRAKADKTSNIYKVDVDLYKKKLWTILQQNTKRHQLKS